MHGNINTLQLSTPLSFSERRRMYLGCIIGPGAEKGGEIAWNNELINIIFLTGTPPTFTTAKISYFLKVMLVVAIVLAGANDLDIRIPILLLAMI